MKIGEDFIYQVGVAREDITPPVGIRLAGWAGMTEPATRVYNPLRTTALVVDDGRTPVLLLGAEWVSFEEHVAAIRARVQQATGISEDRIVLCATHTHTGPLTWCREEQTKGPPDAAYLEQALRAMEAAARRAWATRAPAQLRFASGACAIAASRRRPDGKGGVAWRPFKRFTVEEGARCDHQVPVLTAVAPDGAVRAVLFSYPCHPTGHKAPEIGGDYVGFALNRVEELLPEAVALFAQGCGGDQKLNVPGPAPDSFRSLSVDEIRVLGRQLGEEAVRVARGAAQGVVSGPIAVGRGLCPLEMEKPDPARIREDLNSDIPFVRQWAEHWQDKLARGEPYPTAVNLEVQVLQFGHSLVLISLAGEMTVEYGLRLKRELGQEFAFVLPLAYANGIVGYVPVRRQISEGGYEVWYGQMHRLRPGPFRADTEERIHGCVRKLLGQVP